MKKVSFLYLILLLFSSQGIEAQFQRNGTAQRLTDSCFYYTPAGNFTGGSFWKTAPISLLEDFDISLDVNFGCEDGVGDGIVFSLQAIGTYIGNYNGNLGYEGIAPTFGIEFDTNAELAYSDPDFDHIAVLRDGNLDHSTTVNLAGPVRMLSDTDNIEDCDFHHIRLTWKANTKTLRVFVDCEQRLQFERDISNEILVGQQNVFWGVTSASGATDIHEVCVSTAGLIDEQENLSICKGEEVRLNARANQVSYLWSPGIGLSDTLISNPVASPEVTTLYSVVTKDNCGKTFLDEVLIEVTDIGLNLDLGPVDTLLCEGEELFLAVPENPLSYQWNTGSSDTSIVVTSAGDYSLSVWNADCELNDTISVHYFDGSNLDLGKDTVICGGSGFVLSSTISGEAYRWQDGSTAMSIAADDSDLYILDIEHRCGLLTDSINVSFEDCFRFYAPNAFSPNGDGANDGFVIYGGEEILQINRFTIYNRWGAPVFESRNFAPGDLSAGWKGKYKGKEMNPGVYIWVAEIDFTYGGVKVESGEVTLIR